MSDIDPRRGVDFIGVNCVFFCHDGKGRVLLGKRSAKCRDEVGRWDCGAGAMEHGEGFEQAVRREVREEYGCEPLETRFVEARNVIRDNKGAKTHWVALLFLVRVDPAEAKLNEPEKIDEIGWFSLDALPEPLHSMFWPHFEQVRAKLKTVTLPPPPGTPPAPEASRT